MVEDLITSFWKSLQQDTVMLMSLPDVRQLFGCYDMQLYKGLEDTLLPDFLQDVSIQYLKSVRLFSKRFKLWLLSALEGFPAILQISKLKGSHWICQKTQEKDVPFQHGKGLNPPLTENGPKAFWPLHLYCVWTVTLCHCPLDNTMHLQCTVPGAPSPAEGPKLCGDCPTVSKHYVTMKMVLRNSRRVGLLKSDLRAIIREGTLDISKKVLEGDSGHEEEPESHTEMKCLGCLISLLETSTDLAELLNCVSSNLQVLVFQRTVSKAMTLSHRDSFGAWHLFHLLLLEYVIHILESCMEEEEEEEDLGSLQDLLSDDQFLTQPDQALFHPLDSLPTSECASRNVESPQVTLKHMSQSCGPMGVSSMVLQVLGFLVDTATGNKLIQVLLEDKATESAVKLSLPVGQEALITLSNGQRFVIHISDVPQSSENTYCRKSNANMQGGLLE
ncbi:DNA-binding protein RFX8 [Apodemus speciosus]|uniref:DNA-binding protein RFX8 n=1 Tax=Apodemus speciosus TaxID=105296 RepID=A0ABQ0EDM1_APOSI